jgi:hypothetical protein
VITPLVLRFLGRGEPHQWVAGELLLADGFARVPPSPDLFTRLIAVPVIVNEFLARLLPLAVDSGKVQEHWLSRLFPAQLMQAAAGCPAVRPGAVAVVCALAEVIHRNTFFGFLTVAFEWTDALDVALILLAHADDLMDVRAVGLASGFAELLRQVAASGAPAALARLPRIIGSNPNVFLDPDVDIAPVLDRLTQCPSAEVRAAFLDSFLLLFARTPGCRAQEALLAGFERLFADRSPAVVRRLASADAYSFFAPAKFMRLLPAFTRFVASLRSHRDVGRAASAFLTFPAEVVRGEWRLMLPIFLTRFGEHAHALSEAAPSFCARLCETVVAEDRGELLRQCTAAFAGGSWGARRLVPPLVRALAVGVDRFELVQPLVPRVFAATRDRVPAVVVAAIAAIPRLRDFFAAGDVEIASALAATLAQFEGADDPDIAAAWRAAVSAGIKEPFPGSVLPRLLPIAPTFERMPRRNSAAGARRIMPAANPCKPSARRWPLAAPAPAATALSRVPVPSIALVIPKLTPRD